MGDPGSPRELGVAAQDGHVVAYFNPCEDSGISSIRLIRIDGNKDSPIWVVSSDGAPRPVRDFAVGTAPDGFATELDLQGDSLEGRLLLELQKPDGIEVVEFRLEDLEEDRFRLAGRQYMGQDDYRAADSCQLTRS